MAQGRRRCARLQQVFVQTRGKVILLAARCCNSSRPSGEKRKTEKARCSRPEG